MCRRRPWHGVMAVAAWMAVASVSHGQDACTQEVDAFTAPVAATDGSPAASQAAASPSRYAVEAQDDGGGGNVVEQLQVALLAVGYDPIEIDGIIGRNTRRALGEFCRAFKGASAQFSQRCAATTTTWQEALIAPDLRRWLRGLGTEKGCSYGRDLLADFFDDQYPTCAIGERGERLIGRVGTYYELTEEDAEALQARGELAAAVEQVAQTRYADPVQVMGAVRDALGLTPAAASGLPRGVVNCINRFPEYRLTTDDLNRLRVDTSLAQAKLSAVEPLIDLPFPNRKSLRDRALESLLALSGEGAPQDGADSSAGSAREAANQVAAAARRLYWLNPQAQGFLTRSPALAAVPDDVLGGVTDIVGVPYANRSLFESALRSVLASDDEGGNATPADPSTQQSRLTVAAHASALLRDGSVVTPVLGERSEAFEEDLRRLLAPTATPVATEWVEATAAVALQARKQPVYDRAGPLRWSAAGCGCTADFPEAVVYGFYLPWQGLREATQAPSGAGILGALSETAVPLEPVDLATHTRVGYYALPLGENGETLFDLMPDQGVMRAVRRHDSRLDLVAYKENGDWSAVDQVDAFFDQLLRTLTQGGDDAALLRPGRGGADGVTLFLDGYPTDDAASDVLVQFLKELHTAIDRQRQPLRLNPLRKDLFKRDRKPLINLMLRGSDMGQGIYTSRYLSQLIGPQSDDEPLVDLFLVFLDAPTTDTKKELRLWVERSLRGEQRRTLLRRIVPVIPPAGHRREARGEYVQFQDDLIYFQDNFKGVGFWPMISSQSPQAEGTRERVRDVFADRREQDFLKRAALDLVPNLCTYVCPNRSPIRAVLLLGVLALLGVRVASFFFFSLQAFHQRHRHVFWAIFLGLFAVFAVSLVCDPMLKRRSDDVSVVVMLIGLLLVTLRVAVRADERDMP